MPSTDNDVLYLYVRTLLELLRRVPPPQLVSHNLPISGTRVGEELSQLSAVDLTAVFVVLSYLHEADQRATTEPEH